MSEYPASGAGPASVSPEFLLDNRPFALAHSRKPRPLRRQVQPAYAAKEREVGYPSWTLSNNNAEIRRAKERIASLTRQKEVGYTGWDFVGGRVEANTADNSLQISFEDKPDDETRSTLKSNGFRWAPSAGAWQRQLNDNAILAAGRIDCIRPLTGESPYELQKRVQLEQQMEVGGSELVSEENSQEEPDRDHGMRTG